MYSKRKRCIHWGVVMILFIVLAFCIYCFSDGIKTVFCNTAGQFDYGIMWTAVAAIGTILVSAIAIIQTYRNHRMEIVESNTVRIISDKSKYKSLKFRLDKCLTTYIPNPAHNEVCIYKTSTKKTILFSVFEYKVLNDCIPDAFVVKKIKLTYENGGENILNGDIQITEKAEIANSSNPFEICLCVVDDNIDTDNRDFWFYYSITFIKYCEIGEIAVDYECVSHINMKQIENSVNQYETIAENLLAHKKGKGYIYKGGSY